MTALSRSRFVGKVGCAAQTLSKRRLLVRPATAGSPALLAAPASGAGCAPVLALAPSLLAFPARGAGCSALLAGASVWPSKLARILLPSVMTACCNSVIKVSNDRNRFPSFCCTFHDKHRGITCSFRGLGFCISTDTAVRSF